MKLPALLLFLALLPSEPQAAPLFEEVQPLIKRNMLAWCAPALQLCRYVGDRDGPMEQLPEQTQLAIGGMCGRSATAAWRLKKSSPTDYKALVEVSAERIMLWKHESDEMHRAMLDRCISFWEAN